MSEAIGSGTDFPTITLGGITYLVKFTRGGILYRMNKLGISFSDVTKQTFSGTVDMLYAALFTQFRGSPEDLAELLINEDKLGIAGDVIAEATKKALASIPKPATEAAPQATVAQVQ